MSLLPRPSTTYRASRRNACKELGYKWSKNWYHETHTKADPIYRPSINLKAAYRSLRSLKERLSSGHGTRPPSLPSNVVRDITNTKLSKVGAASIPLSTFAGELNSTALSKTTIGTALTASATTTPSTSRLENC